MASQRLVLALILGIGLVLALLVSLGLSDLAVAAPGDWFVQPGGSGSACTQASPCALQTALSMATNGDDIYLGAGTYTGGVAEVVRLSKSISLLGGWDGRSTGTPFRDPVAYPSVLDGENKRRVVFITGTLSHRLDGLTLQRGDATGLGGDPFVPGFDVGGAVYAFNVKSVISNCKIMSSTAGFGAGAAFYYGIPRLENSTLRGNVAVSGTRGSGGGMFLYQSPAAISNNLISSNVASGTTLYDGGGGLYLDASAATVEGNTIVANQSLACWGAGLYLYNSGANLRRNTILFNLPAQQGGGVFMWGSPATLEANLIQDNEATFRGGGVQVVGCSPFTMTNNILGLNRTTTGDSAGLLVEGGTPGQNSQGTLIHNTFVLNMSSVPWMIHVGGGIGTPNASLALTNTIIDKPGGIWIDQTGSVGLDHTLWHPSLLIQAGLTVTGPGAVFSSNNIYADPVLPGPPFRLPTGSPAIDQGVDMGISTDIDGEARPNGLKPDIGADEYYCHAIQGITFNGPTTSISGTACVFTATVSPLNSTLAITYAWQASSQASVTHTTYLVSDTTVFTWFTKDTQTVVMRASNCGGSYVATNTLYPPHWIGYMPVVLRQ